MKNSYGFCKLQIMIVKTQRIMMTVVSQIGLFRFRIKGKEMKGKRIWEEVNQKREKEEGKRKRKLKI